MSPKPQFEPGETLNIVRYIPPLPKGATVTVKRIEFRGEEYQYVVEGRRTPDGESIEVWADEIDLKMPLIFEAPRKKRKGSLAFELQSTLQASTSISALPISNGNGHERASAAPVAEARVRRRRKSTEAVGGLIPTRTGRAARSRNIDSILFSERPATNGEAKPGHQLKENPKLKEISKGSPAAPATKRRARKTTAETAAPEPPSIPAPKAVKSAKAPARAKATSRLKTSSGAPTRKSSTEAPTKRTRAGAASKESTSGDPPRRSRRPRGADLPADAPVVAKPRKPARRKKRKSATAPKSRAASVAVVTAPERTKRTRTKDAVVGRSSTIGESGSIRMPADEPNRRRTSQQSRSASTGNAFLDGLLSAQTFPGGMMLNGGSGTPIVIIIVNAAAAEPIAETGRKRRER